MIFVLCCEPERYTAKVIIFSATEYIDYVDSQITQLVFQTLAFPVHALKSKTLNPIWFVQIVQCVYVCCAL